MKHTMMHSGYKLSDLQHWAVTMYKLGLLSSNNALVDYVIPVGISMEFAVRWFETGHIGALV